ncbi:protein RKD4-like [Chenopodium quinoa]|uniref:RWP-RK domain-containing protein n=1 Tax=Chenopodium quinoa TaxID=63459 RepID=A0A803L2J0_CHEQI|nr:protein RKD4-like [Chenopodium quinoa]
MEIQCHDLQDWHFLEDWQQRLLFEESLLPPVFQDYLLDYPSTNNQYLNNLENLGTDFQLWDECPPLCEDAWMKPLRQLPPLLPSSLPSMTKNPNPLPFDDAQFSLSDNILNDQSLATVVAEGLTMQKQGNKIVKVSNIVGDDENEEIRKNKATTTKIESIGYEEIRKYFDLPISKAAKELNVGLTILKKRCRELNIKRWPHRKIKSLEALINSTKELGMVQMAERLEEDKRKLHFMPEFELTEETKRLRQQCFKANYKKRRALALNYV